MTSSKIKVFVGENNSFAQTMLYSLTPAIDPALVLTPVNVTAPKGLQKLYLKIMLQGT